MTRRGPSERRLRAAPAAPARVAASSRGGAAARAVAALALVAVTVAVAAAPAQAGSFRVAQCGDPTTGAPRGYQAALWSFENGWPEAECGGPGGVLRLGTGNWRLLNNQQSVSRLAVPASMAQTTLRTAWLDWRFPAQAPSTNPGFLIATSAGARLFVAVPGEAGLTQRSLPEGARGLELTVWCSPVNGPGWCNWPGALLELRGLTLELDEDEPPSASAAGALTAAGEHAGVEPLELSADDGDSGVRSVAVTLGGIAAGALTPPDGCRPDVLPPCPQRLRGTLDVDTRAVPDGPQRLRLRVTDAAGNVRTVDPGTVLVHNQPPPVDVPAPVTTPVPPVVAPLVAAPPAVPVAAGGRTFPPNPLAGRGHVPNGTNASERARVTASLELGGRRLRAATVPPGVRVRIRGRVIGRGGRPVAGAALAAVARQSGDIWRPITGVRTRPNGRFTAFTRIGPSRRLRFVYYAYGDSLHGRRSPELRVRVRR